MKDSNSDCCRDGFAAAVSYADKKRTAGTSSIDGGFDKGFHFARKSLQMTPVANGVYPGGQKVK